MYGCKCASSLRFCFFFGVLCVTGVSYARCVNEPPVCSAKATFVQSGWHFTTTTSAAWLLPRGHRRPTQTCLPELRLSWMFELDPYIHARMDPNWWKGH